jgi:hypothetical protein
MRRLMHISPSAPGVVICPLLWVLLDPAAANAQPRTSAVRLPRVEIGGGLMWSGVSKLGALDATMTANQTGTPERLSFFKVDNQMKGAPAFGGWLGANVSQSLGIEVGFHHGRPDMRTRITGDAEGVADTTVEARLFSQSIVEGNVLLYMNAARFDQEHTIPFVIVGAGYLRHMNSDQTLKETGRIYQVGVGFKWVSGLTQARRARGPGMRLDVRYVVRDGGLDFREDSRRPYVCAGATALMAF